MSKKRRKRRKKVRPETVGGRREESGEEFSEDEDMFTIDMSSDEEGSNDGSRYVCVYVCVCVFYRTGWDRGGRFCSRTAASLKFKLLVAV